MNDEELDEELEDEELDEELEDEELDDQDGFNTGYNLASNMYNNAVNYYNDFKNNNREIQNNDANEIGNNNNLKHEIKNNNSNMQNTTNNANQIGNNQNLSNNANDLVRQERLNSLKNGGNEAAKEALNKGASNASSNAGLGAQIASSAQNISEDMKQPTVDKEGNELDGIDAVKQKGLDASKSIGREAGNIASEIVSDYFTAQSGGASQALKPVVKAIVSKTSEIAAVHATKQLYMIIGLVAVGVIIFLLLIVGIFIAAFGNDNALNNGGEYTYLEDYSSCTKITLTGDYAGTYDLEDYVAGVVASELGGGGLEARKVQAIIARTYAIVSTNKCTTSISNSENQQTYKPESVVGKTRYNNGKVAAEATKGLVLTYEDKPFQSFYAAYPKNGYKWSGYPDCNVSCDENNCTTTVYKYPSDEAYTFTMPRKQSSGSYWNGADLNNQTGHCIGLSQVGAMYYESVGKKYDDIIRIFYPSSVKIASIISTHGTYKVEGEFANWKQCNSDWSNIVMANNNNVCDIGCAATSVSIQLARSGVSLNVPEFNPGVFIQTGLNKGKFTSNGGIYWDIVNLFTNNFKYQNSVYLHGTKQERIDQLRGYINQGYYIVASVRNEGHWVAIDKVENNNVYMFDPGQSNSNNLFESYAYSGTGRIILYKKVE